VCNGRLPRKIVLDAAAAAAAAAKKGAVIIWELSEKEKSIIMDLNK